MYDGIKSNQIIHQGNKLKRKLFIGIRIPRTIINTISMLRSTVNQHNYYNWSSGNNLHITNLFIGFRDDSEIPLIEESIFSVTKEIKKFNIWIEGTGVFSKNQNNQILWLGIKDKEQDLHKINYDLRNMLERYLLQDKISKFHPHITIARKKKQYLTNKIDVNDFINSVYFPIEFRIEYLTLFESKLINNKVHYKKIEKFNLI